MNTKIVKKPKYKNKKFKKEADLWEWIKKVCAYAIYLQDNGQDLQRLWVDNEGEILYCEGQSTVWCSKFIDTNRLHTDQPLVMLLNGEWREMDFIPEEIIR